MLKILSRLTIWGYFRRVKIVGRDKIPKTGPYIFVANHPSAFMDPIVVASAIQPQVYFIAAGEYVGKGLKGWFFQKALHMIPVFRPSTRPELAHKNKDMFIKCHEHLSKKGALLIFPEGVSLTEKKLKPLKTGTVRIAIGAEVLHDFKLGVPIIPIGLNYSNPHTFRSDLFVKIGEPIYVNESLTNAHKTDKTLQVKLTQKITEQLQEKMQATILHMDSEQEEKMLEKLEAVYAKDVRSHLEIAFEDQEGEFAMQKDFIGAINYFKSNKPFIYERTENQIDNYLNKLNKSGLSDRDIGDFKNRYTFRRVLSFILGLPYFIFGLIHNFIPYKSVGFFANKIKLDETFSGSISLVIGLFTFLLWYIGISLLVGYSFLGWWAVFYPVLMYVTGLYALLYSTAIRKSRARNYLRKTVKENLVLLAELTQEREAIITVLSACQKDYLAYKNELVEPVLN